MTVADDLIRVEVGTPANLFYLRRNAINPGTDYKGVLARKHFDRMVGTTGCAYSAALTIILINEHLCDPCPGFGGLNRQYRTYRHAGRTSAVDIATEAPAGFLPRLFRLQPGDNFLVRSNAAFHGVECDAWRAVLFGSSGSCCVCELGEDALPPVLSHEPLVDAAGGLLAVTHRIRHIGSSGNHVAAGIEAADGWFQE